MLQVTLPNGSAVRWTRRTRQLLTILLSATGSRVDRDNVATHLWPDRSAESAYQNLRVTLSSLRKALGGSDLVRIEENWISLAVDSECRDDLMFENTGRPALLANDFEAMSRSIELYQGDYLPDDRYFDWTESRRRDLYALYRRLVLRSWPLAVRAGQIERALAWLESLMVADPSDESTGRVLMGLYLDCGRRLDALRLYTRLKESLRTDLDVDPELETTAIYERAKSPRYRNEY